MSGTWKLVARCPHCHKELGRATGVPEDKRWKAKLTAPLAVKPCDEPGHSAFSDLALGIDIEEIEELHRPALSAASAEAVQHATVEVSKYVHRYWTCESAMQDRCDQCKEQASDLIAPLVARLAALEAENARFRAALNTTLGNLKSLEAANPGILTWGHWREMVEQTLAPPARGTPEGLA